MPKLGFIAEFIAGGWVITLFGAIGMIIRYISGNIKYISVVDTILKILSSAMFTTLVWALIDHHTDIYSWVKALLYGLSGLIGPEIIKGLVFLGSKFANNPIETVKEIKDLND